MNNYCSNCGAQINQGDTFCKKCGTNLLSSQNNMQKESNQQINNTMLNNNKNGNSLIIVIGIVVFVIVALAVYLIVSGNLKFNSNSNKIKNNTNSITNNDNSTNNSYSSIQVGELKVNVPTNYLKEYSVNSQYKIYMTNDGVCSLSIVTTGSGTHKDTNTLIDSMLNGAASPNNGKLGTYNITSKKINNETWNYTTTSLSVSGYTFNEYIYGILKNDNYYAIQYQNMSNDKTCENYRRIVENSLKFN